MPAWVNAGYEEYAIRMPADYRLNLIEISTEKGGKIADEKILSAIKPGLLLALDRQGMMFSTEELAIKLRKWHDLSQNINLLIGGPRKIGHLCLEKAHEIWSLSLMTFPHPLVRVIIAEQIYRAWTILNHHPYHRA